MRGSGDRGPKIACGAGAESVLTTEEAPVPRLASLGAALTAGCGSEMAEGTAALAAAAVRSVGRREEGFKGAAVTRGAKRSEAREGSGGRVLTAASAEAAVEVGAAATAAEAVL